MNHFLKNRFWWPVSLRNFEAIAMHLKMDLKIYFLWEKIFISVKLISQEIWNMEAIFIGLIFCQNFLRILTIHCVKSVQIWSYFWSVFSCIRTEYGSEITPYSDTFHVTILSQYLNVCSISIKHFFPLCQRYFFRWF